MKKNNTRERERRIQESIGKPKTENTKKRMQGKPEEKKPEDRVSKKEQNEIKDKIRRNNKQGGKFMKKDELERRNDDKKESKYV